MNDGVVVEIRSELTSLVDDPTLCSVSSFGRSSLADERVKVVSHGDILGGICCRSRWNGPRERIRSRARSNSNWRRPTNEATISWFPDYFAPLRRPRGTHMCQPYGGEKVSGGLEEQPWRANLFRSHPRLLPRSRPVRFRSFCSRANDFLNHRGFPRWLVYESQYCPFVCLCWHVVSYRWKIFRRLFRLFLREGGRFHVSANNCGYGTW